MLLHSMVLQELDLFCVLLQVPVPLLLYLCWIVLVVRLVVRLMVEKRRQEKVAVGVEGHVVMVRYMELQCLFGQKQFGVHFGQRLLQNAMTTAVEFFNLLFYC